MKAGCIDRSPGAGDEARTRGRTSADDPTRHPTVGRSNHLGRRCRFDPARHFYRLAVTDRWCRQVPVFRDARSGPAARRRSDRRPSAITSSCRDRLPLASEVASTRTPSADSAVQEPSTQPASGSLVSVSEMVRRRPYARQPPPLSIPLGSCPRSAWITRSRRSHLPRCRAEPPP